MKFSTFSSGTLLGLSLILAASAFAGTKDNFQIGNPVTVDGTLLKPGNYTIEWDGTGPNVQVSVIQGKTVKARVAAHLVELKARAERNEAIEQKNTN